MNEPTIATLQNEAFANALVHGFWHKDPKECDASNPDSFHVSRLMGDECVGLKVALFHTEISEMFEEWRAGRAITAILRDANGKPEGIPIELADLVIRVLDFCGRFNIDLESAILEKMAYNQSRPFLHGKKA